MISNNLIDAKQECQDNPSCVMFEDVSGEGYRFHFCKDSSSEYSSNAGTILYRKYNTGNLDTISDL